MSQATIKEAVSKTLDAIQGNPQAAILKYEADTYWERDMRCISKVRHFEPVVIDEPAGFGGDDTAQSPGDLVLTALGGCQEIMYAALASVMDIKLDACSVKVNGTLNLFGLMGLGEEHNVPPGFIDLSFETRIKSPASEEQLKELARAVEKQCPILDTLQRSIKVDGEVFINESTIPCALN